MSEGHKRCFGGIASLSVADRLSETRTGDLPLEFSKVSWRARSRMTVNVREHWRMEVGVNAYRQLFREFC